LGQVLTIWRDIQARVAKKAKFGNFPALPKRARAAQSVMMKKLVIFVVLAACTSVAPMPTAPVIQRLPVGVADTCGAARYQTLLDQGATALERVLILGEVRIIRPSTIVTQDFRPTRMNFHIGTDGQIAQISCG
tara:strand:- start:124141 stop:124542 length:402 start_codon:yes stop_codon:yes gene_type:complete